MAANNNNSNRNNLSLQNFKYTDCLFQARLQKPSLFRLRKKQELYLYVSQKYMIINHQPYAKKPQIVLQLLPTTHVKWLWQPVKRSSFLRTSNKNQNDSFNQLKGFIIQTDGFVGQFIAEKVVLQMLKIKFQQIILQSDFYDQYILGKYLDKGNYAMVYLCTKKDSQKQFAVKILQKQRLKSMKNGKQSVFNELKILRKLNHPNLMHLLQVFEDRNKYYFVLQLLNGITLYKEIQARKKKSQLDFRPHQIRGILKQILQGVKYLHDANIMHRDLKPQNILFQQKSCLQKNNAQSGLKLVDYGLATFQHQKHVIFTKCGTPGFVAPQVISYDQRQPIYQTNVDIFSVGVIFHILLLGQQAFPGRSRNTILNKNKDAKIDFKAKKYQAIASDGLDLLSKMLQKTPEKRISAKEALQHEFLTKDRPIFKFKKSYKEDTFEIKHQPVQKYLNFEQNDHNQSDLTKNNARSSAFSKINQNKSLQQQACEEIQDQLDEYDPFSYDVNQIPSEKDFDEFSVSNSNTSQRQNSNDNIERKEKMRKSSMFSSFSQKIRKQSQAFSDGGYPYPQLKLFANDANNLNNNNKNSNLLQRKIINTFGQRQNAMDQKNLGNFFTYMI